MPGVIPPRLPASSTRRPARWDPQQTSRRMEMRDARPSRETTRARVLSLAFGSSYLIAKLTGRIVLAYATVGSPRRSIAFARLLRERRKKKKRERERDKLLQVLVSSGMRKKKKEKTTHHESGSLAETGEGRWRRRKKITLSSTVAPYFRPFLRSPSPPLPSRRVARKYKLQRAVRTRTRSTLKRRSLYT